MRFWELEYYVSKLGKERIMLIRIMNDSTIIFIFSLFLKHLTSVIMDMVICTI